MLALLQDYIVSTLSTITAAGIAALLAYIFRDKIKRSFLGDSLQPINMIPQVEVTNEISYINSDGIECYMVTVRNTGSLQIYNPRLFLCSQESMSLSIRAILPKTVTKWSNANEGEMLQFEIPCKDLHGFGRNDRWLYLEVVSERGIIYRETFYLLSSKSFEPQTLHRVKKALPKRNLNIFSEIKINKIIEKYDLDLSVG